MIFLLSLLLISSAFSTESIFNLLESAQFEKIKQLINMEKDKNRKNLMEAYLLLYNYEYSKAYEKLKEIPLKEEKISIYLKDLIEITSDFTIYQSTNFYICLKDRDEIMIEQISEDIETIRQEIGHKFKYLPNDKIRIEIYRSKEEFSKASTLPLDAIERSGAVGIAKFNRIMLLSPEALPYGYRWLDTLSHEYIHLIINRLTHANTPLWLHEGLARYYDTIWRSKVSLYLTPGNENILYEIKNTKKFIPFKKMEPSLVYLENQDEVSFAFVQLASFIEFLIEKYQEEKINLLLHTLKELNIENSIKKVYGKSIKKLIEEYFLFLEKKEIKKNPGVAKEKVYISIKNEIDEFISVGSRELIRLGDKLRSVGDYRAAISQYKKTLSEEPYNPIILIKLARAHNSLLEYEESEKYLKTAIEKNPNFVSPYELLGHTYYEQEKYNEAIQVYNEALHINPFNYHIHKTLAKIYIQQKNFKKAKKKLEVSLKLNPYDYEAKLLYNEIKNYND